MTKSAGRIRRRGRGDLQDAPALIVEDDPACAALYAKTLRRLGLAPALASSLPQARRLLCERGARLILLDRHLGGGSDGLSLCLELKKDPRTRLVPVIVLTAAARFADEVKGVRYGADLYLRKPVDLSRLERYVKALVGRLPYTQEVGDVVRCGAVALHKTERALRVGRKIYRNLSPKQADFLALLASRQGAPVSRRFLIQKLWRNSVRDKEVDVLVSRLKRRLGPEASSLILPVRSHGYRLALIPRSS